MLLWPPITVVIIGPVPYGSPSLLSFNNITEMLVMICVLFCKNDG